MFIQPASSLSPNCWSINKPLSGVAHVMWLRLSEVHFLSFFLIQNNSYKSHGILKTYFMKEEKTTPLNIYTGARECLTLSTKL